MVCPGPICFASVTAAGHIDAGRASQQQAFLAQQAIHIVHGLRIGYTQRVVDRSALEIRRHPTGAYALGDRGAAVGFEFAVP